MSALDGNLPIARNGPMRSNSYNTRRRFTPFGSPQVRPHRLLGNERYLPYAFSLKDFLQRSKELLRKPSQCKRVKVGLISNLRTILKLKLISLFADMEKDRAQAGFKDTFKNRSNSCVLWLGREIQNDFVL